MESWMPGNQSLAQRYREVAVRTATPLQLIVILYDTAICSIREAREHVDHNNIAGRSRSINKCIAIISELQSCLNLKDGGEIADSLDRLYDYMKRRLFLANVEQSIEPLTEIDTLLENLRSAWGELVAQAQGAAPQSAGQELPERAILEAAAPVATKPKSLNISI